MIAEEESEGWRDEKSEGRLLYSDGKSESALSTKREGTTAEIMRGKRRKELCFSKQIYYLGHQLQGHLGAFKPG